MGKLEELKKEEERLISQSLRKALAMNGAQFRVAKHHVGRPRIVVFHTQGFDLRFHEGEGPFSGLSFKKGKVNIHTYTASQRIQGHAFFTVKTVKAFPSVDLIACLLPDEYRAWVMSPKEVAWMLENKVHGLSPIPSRVGQLRAGFGKKLSPFDALSRIWPLEES